MRPNFFKKLTIITLGILLKLNCLAQDGLITGKPSLAYWKVGNKKETVIVLHGGPSVTHDYLRPEFDALKKYAQVIYYDQRGCGKSENAGDYRWQNHVLDLKRVKERFSKDRKVILAGSSWGSILAILYAFSFPEDIKGMILSGTVFWHGKEEDPKVWYGANCRYFTGPTEIEEIAIKEIRLDTVITTEGIRIDSIQIIKMATGYNGPARSMARSSFMTAPFLKNLSTINHPILIFNGTIKKYKIIDWGHIYVKIFPNATLYTINGASHDPWLSNPKIFFSKSNLFIKELINE